MNRHAQVQPSNVAEAFRPPAGDLKIIDKLLTRDVGAGPCPCPGGRPLGGAPTTAGNALRHYFLYDLKVAATLLIALLALALAACGQGKSQAPQTFDLEHEQPALVVSAAQSDDGPLSIAAGDVNGDGHPDLIVGAAQADGPANSRPDCGEAYVIFGPAAQGGTIDLAQDEPDVTILGADSEDRMGFSAAAGDVNGDGIDDILLGAPLADGPANDRPQAGEVYVILGSPSLEPAIDLALGQQALTLFGAEEEDRLGISVTAGDVNGDGRADVLAGAFLADGPDNARYQAGEAYLLLGGPSLGGARDVAQGEYDLAIIAADEDDQLGYAVATGDLNADGIGDLIIGAFRADGPGNARNDTGEAYVIFGSRALGGVLDLASAPANLAVTGAHDEDDLGAAVASGDVNGDGVDDLLLGAPRADGPDDTRDRAGEAYVVFGSASLQGSVDIDRAEQDVTILGADPGDRLGLAVAGDDIDGDGIDDVVLGAEGGDGPENDRENAGEAHVIPGSASPEPMVDIALSGTHGAIFGELTGDRFGGRVAAADWDGDGRADVLAITHNAGSVDAPGRGGRAYVISVGPRLRDSR